MKKYKRGKFLYHFSKVAGVSADRLDTVLWRIKDEVGDELIIYKDGRFGFQYNEDPTERVARCLKGSDYYSMKNIRDDLVAQTSEFERSVGTAFRPGRTTWDLILRVIHEVRSIRAQDKAKRIDPYKVDFMTRQNRKVALTLRGLIDELVRVSGKMENDVIIHYRGTNAFKREDVRENICCTGTRLGNIAFPDYPWGWRQSSDIRKATFRVDLSCPVEFGTRGFRYGNGLCGVIGSKWLRVKREVLRVNAYSSTCEPHAISIILLSVRNDLVAALTLDREDPSQTIVFGQGYSPSGWLAIGRFSNRNTFKFLSPDECRHTNFISELREGSNEELIKKI